MKYVFMILLVILSMIALVIEQSSNYQMIVVGLLFIIVSCLDIKLKK